MTLSRKPLQGHCTITLKVLKTRIKTTNKSCDGIDVSLKVVEKISVDADDASVIFVLIYFLVLVLVLVFQLLFRFSLVLVLQYFFVLVLVLPTTK